MFSRALENRLHQTPRLAGGLMVGTSLDGVDAAIVEWDDQGSSLELRGFHCEPLPESLRNALRSWASGAMTSLGELAAARDQLAEISARALRLAAGGSDFDLTFVASHGVTLLHTPGEGRGWQLSCGAQLATRLGVPVVDDFRAADLAAGGEGAPLAPICDLRLRVSLSEDRAILNLGGIANISLLPAGATRLEEVVAADIGPANLPLDSLRRHQTDGRESFDRDGATASAGQADPKLVAELMKAPWIRQPLPRSFGREEFGDAWVEAFAKRAKRLNEADQLATLVAFEAEVLAYFLERQGAWQRRPDEPWRLLLSGGGRHHAAVRAAFAHRLGKAVRVQTIEALGVDGDAKEAIDFALLGLLCLRAEASSATRLVLGSIHWPDAGMTR